MKKGVKKILTLSSKLSKELALRSCSVISVFDTYQPVRPEAVIKNARIRSNK